jgi:hypothetical protein
VGGSTNGAHKALLDDGSRSGDGTVVVGRLVLEVDGFEASVVAL